MVRQLARFVLVILRHRLGGVAAAAADAVYRNCAPRQTGYPTHMDEKLLEKLQKAADEVNAIIRKRGPMFFDEITQLFADHLANHPDPDVRNIQAAHERQIRKDLN
jgi:hypothetical protein